VVLLEVIPCVWFSSPVNREFRVTAKGWEYQDNKLAPVKPICNSCNVLYIGSVNVLFFLVSHVLSALYRTQNSKRLN
jgi:hypothetical protein